MTTALSTTTTCALNAAVSFFRCRPISFPFLGPLDKLSSGPVSGVHYSREQACVAVCSLVRQRSHLVEIGLADVGSGH